MTAKFPSPAERRSLNSIARRFTLAATAERRADLDTLLDEGVRFLSIDPGDMDTPLHALAVPDADPATLKRPEAAARELADAIAAALPQESPVP
jgi:NAD(P)-dependent dehydrogenase (short-subunit alcohol dehydrogenase family)